jgi:RNA polymerase sigma-70 factor, ECF subfamily
LHSAFNGLRWFCFARVHLTMHDNKAIEKNAQLPADTPSATVDDEALMRALQAGSNGAYVLLFDRYLRLVLLTAWRLLSDPADAEALAEVILQEIAYGAGEYDASKGVVKKWIAEQAYRRVISHKNSLMLQKKHQRVRARSEVADKELCFEAGAKTEAWSQTLDSLSHGQPRVLRMVLEEGLSFAEVAETTNQPIERIRGDYYRAVDKIRDRALARMEEQQSEPAITLGRIRRANA